MSTRSTPVGFSLHDFLTRIIPGSVILAPALTGLYVFFPNFFSNVSLIVVLIAIMSFLCGELIEQLRIGLFRVPMPFRYLIYNQTGDISKMPFWYQKEKQLQKWFPERLHREEPKGEDYLPDYLNMDFRSQIENEFDIDFVSHSPRDIYDLLILSLEPNFSSRTRRHQSLYAFSKNLQIATAIAIFLYLGEFLLNMQNEIIQIAIISLIGVLTLIFVSISFLIATPHLYVELLLKEYYLKSKQSERVSEDTVGASITREG